MRESVVVLCGGGPAPGMNTVVGSITKVFDKNGYRVLGLHGGYSELFSKETKFQELDFEFADEIFKKGGSQLTMSRFKPSRVEDINMDFFIENNIKLLITVGGDDTASTANRIATYLNDNHIAVKNIHVPKTIDNDLPLPEGVPTFGYNTAKSAGTEIANTIYEDAKTSKNWFVLAAMGREAGHLAFGIGASAHYPMIIIPEMFNKAELTFENIIRLSVSSIVKRKILGLDYGAISISEGVFHFFSDDEIKNSGINFTYDAHGHPELYAVSKSHVFASLIQKRLQKLEIGVKTRPVELGFEIRCARPIGYDLTLCTLLGLGVYKLFKEGETACMVCVDSIGDATPLYLKDVADESGRVKARLVNMEAQNTKAVIEHNLHYITEDDYIAAKKYLPNPEDYDFRKILKM